MKTKLIKLKQNMTEVVTEDVQYVLDNSDLNGTLQLDFKTEGVTAEIVCVYRLRSGEQANFSTVANHLVPNTQCLTKVKGVLEDRASSEYVGKIIIAKPAQQTSSFLDDKVLVIGENTHNKSEPILEIEADDVKASHGATTGRVDSEQVYYLQSRGLSESEAKDVIVTGFLESLLLEIGDVGIRKLMLSQLGLQHANK